MNSPELPFSAPLEPGQVVIPQTPRQAQLANVNAGHAELLRLLVEREADYLGFQPDRVGGWRHNPLAWQARRRPPETSD